MALPIIRLEIEGMKHAISTALSEHAAKMDKDVQDAIQSYCAPDNIRRIISQAANKALSDTIREEVDAFFRYGEGRKIVAAAIKEKILKNETFTPLDNI